MRLGQAPAVCIPLSSWHRRLINSRTRVLRAHARSCGFCYSSGQSNLFLEDEPKAMPDASDSLTPRPDVAAAPAPVARADAASRAQRIVLPVQRRGAPPTRCAIIDPRIHPGRRDRQLRDAWNRRGPRCRRPRHHDREGRRRRLASGVARECAGVRHLAHLGIPCVDALPRHCAGCQAHLRIIDHSCIYVLIAGSYTPFCLVTLADAGGVPLCIAVWAIAVAGILSKRSCASASPAGSRSPSISSWVRSWCSACPAPGAAAPHRAHPARRGGVCYTVGTVFYVPQEIRYTRSSSMCGCLPAASCSSWRWSSS